MAAAPTRDEAKAFTGDQATQTAPDRLAAFRDPNGSAEPMPEPFNENVEPAAAAPAPAPPAEPEKKNPEDAPPMRRDPRAEIAQRARERREIEDKQTVETFGDLNAPPAGIAMEGAAPPPDPRNDNQGNDNREPPPARETPKEPQTYNLRINRQDYPVSKDDLIRYAGLTPEEAVGIPELSLVRAAQINLAAEERLAAAKQPTASRPAAPDALPYQGEDQRHVDQPAEQRQPALNLKEAVQKIQLGDEEEAAQALLETISTVTNEQFAQKQAADRIGHVRDQIERDLQSFARDNQDILADEMMTDAHRNAMVREALTDLAQIPGVTRDHVIEAMNNPARAMQLYQAVVADGYSVRPPAEIFNAAAGKVRAAFGRTASSHADPGPDPRLEAKRGLIQQPAHNDAGQTPVPQQSAARRSASDVIRGMRQARHQDPYSGR